jgi:anti-sigma B factor antagonist
MPDEDFLPKRFVCEVIARDGAVRVCPHGELDISTVPELEQHLRDALAGGARRIVIDLRGLEFMDSTGLTLVTRYNNESRRDGFEFMLVRGDARIQRLFDLTGLGDYFTFVAG